MPSITFVGRDREPQYVEIDDGCADGNAGRLQVSVSASVGEVVIRFDDPRDLAFWGEVRIDRAAMAELMEWMG